MGASLEPSTSGLHHDFHDNWYLLFAGSKTFRLYSPADYSFMQLYGKVDCIHSNGLISYESYPLRANGVPLSVLETSKEIHELMDDYVLKRRPELSPYLIA